MLPLIQIIREKATELAPLPTDVPPRLKKLSHVEAVAFDIYGTMFVSGVGEIGLAAEEGRDSAIRSALEAAGLRFIYPTEDLGRQFHDTVLALQEARRQEDPEIRFPEVEIREVWDTLLNDLCRREIIEGEITRARLSEIAVRYEMLVNPVWPMPGVQEIVQTLSARQIPLGIVSNAQFFTMLLFDAFFEADVEAFGLDPLCSVWSFLKREAKPSRRLFRIAADKWYDRYRLKPAQVLYIGNDVRNDIWPAHAEGFKTALFAGDRRSLRLRQDDPDCNRVRPDVILTDLRQLNDVLK